MSGKLFTLLAALVIGAGALSMPVIASADNHDKDKKHAEEGKGEHKKGEHEEEGEHNH
jgi:hypothetical protein